MRDTDSLTALESEYQEAFSSGEFFKAFDLAQSLFNQSNDKRWGFRATLSMANAGALQTALTLYENYALSESPTVDSLALLGRIYKDLYFAQEKGDPAFLSQAIAAYQTAFEFDLPRFNIFPAINVATLALFQNKPELAKQWASQVLQHLADSDTTSNNYWDLATEIEAKVILEQTEHLDALVSQALALNQGQYAQLSSTARQLQRITRQRGECPSFLKRLSAPSVLHFTGHIVSASGRFRYEHLETVSHDIHTFFDHNEFVAAYGSLAAGADLLFAKACLEKGISLNVVLPFNLDEFIAVSVAPAGKEWVDLFHACIEKAKTVRYATEDAYLEDDSLFAYTSDLAMGLARVCARHLNTEAMQVAVWDRQNANAEVGTGYDTRLWQTLGYSTHVIEVSKPNPQKTAHPNHAPAQEKTRQQREVKVMLFGDVVGFSKLNDEQLPIFINEFLSVMATTLAPFQDQTEVSNTWGDGLFLVFKQAEEAAKCALALQQAVENWRKSSANHALPNSLDFRIGIHAGPVYNLKDPLTLRPNVYGHHVSRAARIEPVAPAGSVYVTETVAALLALSAQSPFQCDYVGKTQAAKNFGSLRMFLLKKNSQTNGPAVLRQVD